MVKTYPVAAKQKSVDICRAFVAGVPRNAHGAVFYGVNSSNYADWKAVQARGEDWYYIDNSYFDVVRGSQYRVTKNRVQVDVLAAGESDGERFRKLGLTIKPWRAFKRDAHRTCLIVQQSPSFMQYVAEDPDWLEHRAMSLPRGFVSKVRGWMPDKLRQQETFRIELATVNYVMTHSSAAAVEAALAGVYGIVSEMSALAQMICSNDPEHDERRRYMNVLADNQWTLDEIKEGRAWAWLHRDRAGSTPKTVPASVR